MPIRLTQRLRGRRHGAGLGPSPPLLLPPQQRPAPSAAGTRQAAPPNDTAAFVAAALVACSAMAAAFAFHRDTEHTLPAPARAALSRPAAPAGPSSDGIDLRTLSKLPARPAHRRPHASRRHRRRGVSRRPANVVRPSPTVTPVQPQPTASAPSAAPPPTPAPARPAPRRRSVRTPTFDSSGEPFDSSG